MASHAMKARGNAIGLWIHRAFRGRLDGGGKVGGVLMLTTPGRRTGLPRSTITSSRRCARDAAVSAPEAKVSRSTLW